MQLRLRIQPRRHIANELFNSLPVTNRLIIKANSVGILNVIQHLHELKRIEASGIQLHWQQRRRPKILT